MAALLNQRAAGVLCEAIPIAHLRIKRFAVLPNGYLLQTAALARMREANQLSYRRHVAIFLRHPCYFFTLFAALDQIQAVSHCGNQRLFCEHMHIRSQHFTQDVSMCEIRRGHDDCITRTTVEQSTDRVKHSGLHSDIAAQRERCINARLMRIL